METFAEFNNKRNTANFEGLSNYDEGPSPTSIKICKEVNTTKIKTRKDLTQVAVTP